jgi:hypothetical protein
MLPKNEVTLFHIFSAYNVDIPNPLQRLTIINKEKVQKILILTTHSLRYTQLRRNALINDLLPSQHRLINKQQIKPQIKLTSSNDNNQMQIT